MNLLDNYIDEQLYLGLREYINTTHKDCVWRNAFKDRKLCTKDVRIWLYSNGTNKELIDPMSPDWLLDTPHWNADKENVIFIHGYAAGDGSPPTLIMQEAFIQSGEYNFFMIDYGPVSRAPCYVSLVQNIKYVSNCVASYLKNFMNSGMQKQSITCIGHSIGAHGCGLLRRYLGFRLKKIIGLDAALPLISDTDRLSWRDATFVQTIQTNAGYYGDIGSIGHLDVCINNGNMQPFCQNSQNPNLCSHLYAMCFVAQSLFNDEYQMEAKRCTQVCPHLSVFQIAKVFNPSDQSAIHDNSIAGDTPDNIVLSMNMSAHGSYCLSAMEKPFCSRTKEKIGTRRCCSFVDMFT
ncbi:phospholipase A1 member A-like isoform X2 [Sitodiplosis mosellana]|uniref:phospholipase A1 member A-like isoform X2 n=1 Tax=Sitodiplosis mosellana TaxID=263140 RepID=UPI002444DA05|nr:phospholipase A1 member A-like isoform X2 [Sitodiplosis mosellana]